MAESGKKGERKREDKGGPVQEPHSPAPDLSPVGTTSFGTKRHLPRGIVIQLTGTEGEWDSLDDSELIFSLDHDEDYPSVSFTKERHLSIEDDRGFHSQAFHVPLSPSIPDSLGNCLASGPSYLSPGPSSPTHRPLPSLVKSLSTELELKDSSTLRPKPLLSLVKSISTELSRSEPEVSQSKSDSRLNLHLWKQLTQPKTRSNGDSRTAPPSPSSPSPSGEGLKGGFLKMELEDTKRKLSEAMHEPLSSMFSKLMKEEGTGSPKHQYKTQGAHQGSSRALGQGGSRDTVFSECPVRNARKTDADVLPVFDWPSVRHLGRTHHSRCPVHPIKQNHTDAELEICTDGDMMQVLAIETHRQARKPPAGSQVSAAPVVQTPPLPQPPHPLPQMSLFCVAVLSYSYFTLPLSPYLSGLALGLALGFLLGLLLIRMGSSKPHCTVPAYRPAQTLLGEVILAGGTVSNEHDTLKGWMNEIHDYDPETFHLALTHSVFATLEGSCLRLDSSRTNIRRRAAYDEGVHEATFVKSRSFQLAKSRVFLLPSVLAQKRMWNPKYPICIQLACRANSQEDGEGSSEERQGAEPGAEAIIPKQSSSKHAHGFPTILYLFGRTGREKEEWFRHFLFASMDTEREKERNRQKPGRYACRPGDPALAHSVSASGNVLSTRGSSRVGSSDDDATFTPPFLCTPAAHASQTPSSTRGLSLLDYHSYMACLLASGELTPLSSPGVSSTETSPTIKGHCTCDLEENPGKSQAAWLNALIGRIFWDFLRDKHWANTVSHKIQKKLSKIKLPYFMNELTLTELDMGSSMPYITATSRPEINHRGLWLEMHLVYTGALQMTLQTKFNLSKLGKEGNQDTDCTSETGSPRSVLSVLADSDEESSSAGSSDEEELLLSEPQGQGGEKGSTLSTEGTGGGRAGRKILRFVNKIAKSKYFQKATENEFIKKKFEEMSNMPLLLTVEVQELSGPLVINIPPPPTDRIWYSFCMPPKLDLHVHPKLGEREVTFCHVTEWIEKKLQDEFHKVLVLPNMDDIYLPLMRSGVDIHPDAPQPQHSQNSSREEIPPETSRAESH
uniref:SMP-LTD domain-containing protein n=1 Tax=Monopterus albus TaxID=43700 RepID=A0A3Q3R4B6_MONAL|nr:testis-expressed protein 2-like [Monopterus albus]XP_020471509.1 testis-expressed protein 2-like [Monopterus albus]